MFRLGDILKEQIMVERTGIPELSVGYYYEEELWGSIEPYGNKWKTKKRRPLVVIRSSEDYVYFILLTTVEENFFPCDLLKTSLYVVFAQRKFLTSISDS